MSTPGEKRAERARLKREKQKERRASAQPTSKPDTRPEAAPQRATPPAPIQRNTRARPPSLQRMLRKAGGCFVGIATILSLLPLLAGPSVSSPVPAFPDKPFSVSFEVTNENPLPAFNLEYTCDLDQADFQNGSSWKANVVRFAQGRRTLRWKEVMTARCERGFVDLPNALRSAQYSISIEYFPFLWPWRRTIRRTYTGIIDPETHRLGRWVPK